MKTGERSLKGTWRKTEKIPRDQSKSGSNPRLIARFHWFNPLSHWWTCIIKCVFMLKIWLPELKTLWTIIGAIILGYLFVKLTIFFKSIYNEAFLYRHINSLWHSVYHWCEGDPKYFFIIIPVCLRISFYWTVCLPFTLIDLTGKPEFLHKYKIQKLDFKKYPVTVADAVAVARRVLFNQTFVAIPCVILIYYLWKFCEFRGLKYEAPSIFFIIIHFFLHAILSEIIVYCVHRTLHARAIYKHIHKTHHLWDAPISMTAVYVHPVEHVFMNVIPFYLPAVICGAHPVNLWIWISIGTSYNVLDHIGYHLPFFPHSPEFHDFHHKRIWNNFGSVGFIDKLFGTDDLFKKSKEYQRHTILLSFKSMKELIPDDD